MITKIVLALCVGVATTLWYMQYDPWVQQRFEHALLNAMSAAFDCSCTGNVRSLNFFKPCVELENVYASSKGLTWSWHVDRLVLSYSWIDFLCNGLVVLNVHASHARADSTLQLKSNGTLESSVPMVGFWEFIEKLTRNTKFKLPIMLKSLAIEHARFYFFDAHNSITISTMLNCALKKISKAYKATVMLHDAYIQSNSTSYLRAGTFDIALYAPTDQSAQSSTTLCVDGSCQMPEYVSSPCTLHALWSDARGNVAVKSTDDQINIELNDILFDANSFAARSVGRVQLSLLKKIFDVKKIELLQGICSLAAYMQKKDNLFLIDADLKLENIEYGDIKIVSEISSSLRAHGQRIEGVIHCMQDGQEQATGTMVADIVEQKLRAEFCNTTNWNIAYVDATIPAHDMKLTIDSSAQNTTISHQAVVRDNVQQKNIALNGTCVLERGDMSMVGVFDSMFYKLTWSLIPSVTLIDCLVWDAAKQYAHVCAINGQHNRWKATIDAQMVQKMAHIFNVPISTNGQLILYGLLRDNCVYGTASLSHITLAMHHFHNMLHDLFVRFVIDFDRKRLLLRDGICSLHRGTIQCNRASLWFDEQKNLSLAHVPLIFNNCFVNWTRDIVASISGATLFQKRTADKAYLRADLFIDRAQIKYNIFSSQLSKDMIGVSTLMVRDAEQDVECDIRIMTKDPVRIKTPFLETNVKIGMQLTGSMVHPRINGGIELLSGQLAFPYKPLHVTKGSVLFGHHSDDPLVHLFAKNRIKKYQVQLQVTGSLNSPHIMLEASPPLSEEAIVSLLLVGSEHDALSLVIPTLIANNIKNLLFSDSNYLSAVQRYIHRFLRPLKYIHVVPSFTDQSGRGGLRGGIEVELSDRLRAYLQKNFSLTEDTRFEVDYDVSDDVRVKALRDERGDMSAEVEMRWKF